MTDLARISRHPTDRDVVLVHTPHELRHELGRFEPARYSAEHKAYLVHGDHIASLYRFARTINLHVVDERRQTAGHRTQPVECSSCGQAGSMGNPPKMCPACGETWVPSLPPIREDAKWNTTECPDCRHRQHGRFRFCSQCGTEMSYANRAQRRPILPEGGRVKLADPIPIGQHIPKTSLPQFRPIEDVELPPSPDDDGGEPPGW